MSINRNYFNLTYCYIWQSRYFSTPWTPLLLALIFNKSRYFYKLFQDVTGRKNSRTVREL